MERTLELNKNNFQGKSIVYVMSRDQRVKDNHALSYAQKLSLDHKLPLIVAFNFYPQVKNRNLKHYEFMLQGLKETQKNLNELNIPFVVTIGKAIDNYILIEKELNPSVVVFDFLPLRGPRHTKYLFAQKSKSLVIIVDTHNIVPVWAASNKQEFAAYTFRPKIKKLLEKYLIEPKQIIKNPFQFKFVENSKIIVFTAKNRHNHIQYWEKIQNACRVLNIKNYNFQFKPGEKEALKTLKIFLEKKLGSYDENRNNPSIDNVSNLSPYLHFGMISSLRITLEVIKFCKEHNLENSESKKSFLEELIVRKELSDNFCYYNKNYDNFKGIPEWAQKTLNDHKNDKREYIYSVLDFENAKTHDDAWNAAQIQMMSEGKMHGYMRMYWAKKILEWSESPEEAIKIAIYLNDKYNLDGYDPNGYVGILWSIGGLHDRPWFERKIFGKIRYMNYNGLKRKFDIDSYINKYCK